MVVGGAAAGVAIMATDRRTSGTQLEDQNISLKAERAMSRTFGKTARVNANTYEGVVLLTGEVPNDAAKAQATLLAQDVENVKKVVNQLTVGPISPFSTRSADTWLSSKVRTELLNTDHVPSGSISVTTDKSVVYLQGKMTQTEGEHAANAAASVSGVTRVVKLFDTISREKAERLSGRASHTPAPANATLQDAAAIESADKPESGAQAMPIK
jgi:osmotically-inducible protein OsmY